jgi:hypothetical protein
MHTTPTPGDDVVDGAAMDWLQGRLRWERILRNLHDKAEGTAPIVPVADITEATDTVTPTSSEGDQAA